MEACKALAIALTYLILLGAISRHAPGSDGERDFGRTLMAWSVIAFIATAVLALVFNLLHPAAGLTNP